MAPLAGVSVSHQWIYSLIWDDKARGGDLGRHHSQPKCRNKYRPDVVDDRRFIGHWEGDTVIQGHKQSGLVTLVERRSGYLLATRLPRFSAELTQATMIRLLKPRRGAIKTITLDNGSEFTGHEAVAKAVTAAMYFCYPYCSGQRGTNENTNGLIRQYFPKGTNFR